MSGSNKPIPTGGNDLSIIRVFKAPRDVVFKAWTEPDRMARWLSLRGFTVVHELFDLRPGGAYRSCMRAPDGAENWLRGVYREVVKPERLVFTHAWEREDGSASPETLVTVNFVDLGGATEMTFHQAGFETTNARDGHRDGWSQSFDNLGDYLATTRDDKGMKVHDGR